MLKVFAVDGDVYDEGVLYLLSDSDGLGSRDGLRYEVIFIGLDSLNFVLLSEIVGLGSRDFSRPFVMR